jgi:hypothetical protein
MFLSLWSETYPLLLFQAASIQINFGEEVFGHPIRFWGVCSNPANPKKFFATLAAFLQSLLENFLAF